MDTWRSAQITGNLLEVPGIGPAAVRMLAEGDVGVEKITNTYQVRIVCVCVDRHDRRVETSSSIALFCSFLWHFFFLFLLVPHDSCLENS